MFQVKRNNIKESYIYGRPSSVDLYEILVVDIKLTPEKLGFDLQHLPDHKW